MKLTYTFWSVKLIFGTYITLGAINVFSCCDKLSFSGLGRARFLHASVSEPEFEPTSVGGIP